MRRRVLDLDSSLPLPPRLAANDAEPVDLAQNATSQGIEARPSATKAVCDEEASK